MKAEENKDKFREIEIVITIQSRDEAERLKKALSDNITSSIDGFNSIINILNSHL